MLPGEDPDKIRQRNAQALSSQSLNHLADYWQEFLSFIVVLYIINYLIGLSESVISLKEKGNNFFMASGLLMAQKLFFKRLLTLMVSFL